VLTCGLYAGDGGSFTAAELIQRLRVSAASISKAVGYLEGLRLVRREPGPGARQRYLIDDDVWSRAWSESARANAAWGEVSRYGAEVLGPDTPAGARLAGMGRFFERLSEDMGGGVDMAEAYDALTVLAALVHAARPLPADALATALGWPVDRVAAALRCAEEHADIAGAVTVRSVEPASWTVVANPARLTTAQRAALDPLPAPHGVGPDERVARPGGAKRSDYRGAGATPHRPRRRLRGPVRPAHRPPRAGSAGLLRDRAG
jgi:hypothetical protein